MLARDENALLQWLAAGVTELPDGGGKVRAALRPIAGPSRVARVLFGLARKYEGGVSIEPP